MSISISTPQSLHNNNIMDHNDDIQVIHADDIESKPNSSSKNDMDQDKDDAIIDHAMSLAKPDFPALRRKDMAVILSSLLSLCSSCLFFLVTLFLKMMIPYRVKH